MDSGKRLVQSQKQTGFEYHPKTLGEHPRDAAHPRLEAACGQEPQLHGCLGYAKYWTQTHTAHALLARCPTPMSPTHPILDKTSCLFCPLWQRPLSAGDRGRAPSAGGCPGRGWAGATGGDGTRRAGCRQHGHAGSPAAGDRGTSHSSPKK